jgi:DNA transformation protein and related proteins
MPRKIEDMRNLGPASARLLASIGVRNDADLRRMGALEAFSRLRFETDGRVSLNLLWALDGALDDIDWRRIDQERRRLLLGRVAPHGRRGP